MSNYSVLNAKSDLTGIVHGTTLNQITNLNGLFNRAARQLLQDLDPAETIRYSLIGPVFDQVFDYSCPIDLKGTKIIDIAPQVNRLGNVFLSRYNQDFDIAKTFSLQDLFTITYNGSIKVLKLNFSQAPSPIVVDTMSSITDNGTYSVSGGGANLSVDSQNFVVGGSSLKFDLSLGQSTGYVQNTTLTTVDLTDTLNEGTQFLWVYLPNASSVTAIELRWGSSTSNYYSLSVTTTQSGTAFQNGWNLLSFNWSSASTTGTPVITDINFVRVTFSYDSTLQTGVHVNGLTSQLGSLLNVEYYSECLFRDSLTLAFQATVTDDSNLINLELDSYNIYLNQLSYLVCQQLQGSDAQGFDAGFFLTSYQEGIKKYKAMYKGQVQKPQSNYYHLPFRGFNRFIGRRWR